MSARSGGGQGGRAGDGTTIENNGIVEGIGDSGEISLSR